MHANGPTKRVRWKRRDFNVTHRTCLPLSLPLPVPNSLSLSFYLATKATKKTYFNTQPPTLPMPLPCFSFFQAFTFIYIIIFLSSPGLLLLFQSKFTSLRTRILTYFFHLCRIRIVLSISKTLNIYFLMN